MNKTGKQMRTISILFRATSEASTERIKSFLLSSSCLKYVMKNNTSSKCVNGFSNPEVEKSMNALEKSKMRIINAEFGMKADDFNKR